VPRQVGGVLRSSAAAWHCDGLIRHSGRLSRSGLHPEEIGEVMKQKSCAYRTSIGGQALIEGILMRGPKKQSVVVRTKNGLVKVRVSCKQS